MSDPKFITAPEVYYLHDKCLCYGGDDGVRDPGLIESALASAKNEYFYRSGDMYDIAATYAYHLAEAQAFVDGNKRTAVAVAISGLAINGINLPADDGSTYQAMIDIAEKRLDKNGLAIVFKTLAETKFN